MKIKHNKIQNLIDEIDSLLIKIKSYEKTFEEQINQVGPEYKKSAKNLIHYLAIRSVDLSTLQNQLGRIGLSRFARAEGHVLSSLLHSRFIPVSVLIRFGKVSITGKCCVFRVPEDSIFPPAGRNS